MYESQNITSTKSMTKQKLGIPARHRKGQFRGLDRQDRRSERRLGNGISFF
jgi:hypothetical protein